MWINPQTGKGWTDEEEAAFAEIMAAGGLARLPAIRLYRRLGCDLKRALKCARETGEVRNNRRAGAVKRFEKRMDKHAEEHAEVNP